MGNTYFLLPAFIFCAFGANAQFNTITRNSPIEIPQKIKQKQSAEHESVVQSDTTSDMLHVMNKEPWDGNEHSYAYARKRNVRNPNKQRYSTLEQVMEHKRQDNELPSLTIPNLIKEIKKNKIQHPEIVLAQAILETGWFTSRVCKYKHNLFGLTNPKTGKYYEFSHWTESVTAYYTKVQYRYTGGNYLYWLRNIGYAEAPNYIQALIRVIKQLRNS